MIGSLFFIFNRLVEIVFLIPIIGMLVRDFPWCHCLLALSIETHLTILDRRTLLMAT